VHTGPGVFAPRPSARARTAWVAVLLSVVVVWLLGSAAPGFADGPAGGRSDDRVLLSSAPPLAPPAAVVRASSPTVAPVGAPSSPAAPVPDAPAPAQVAPAPPPAARDAGGDRRAESPRTLAERSFTALLLLMAAVLVFLAVHSRVDRHDPKLGDPRGNFRRFR
jgi:hypothetical protein